MNDEIGVGRKHEAKDSFKRNKTLDVTGYDQKGVQEGGREGEKKNRRQKRKRECEK